MTPRRGPVSEWDRPIGLYLRDCWPDKTPVFAWFKGVIHYDGWHELTLVAVLRREEAATVMRDWSYAFEDLSADPELSANEAASLAWIFARDSYLDSAPRTGFDSLEVLVA